MTDDLRIAPANEHGFDDLQAVLATVGPAARCQCQRYRLLSGEAFKHQPVEERRERLRDQVGCGGVGAPTSGLLALSGDEPVGWCAVGPRADLVGLTRVFTVPWKDRDEDREDASVWAVTCVVVRKGHRHQGIATALIAATVHHARSAGARSVEGYPITRTDVITEELHVGTVPMFAAAGYRQVSAPTSRRVVMRVDF